MQRQVKPSRKKTAAIEQSVLGRWLAEPEERLWTYPLSYLTLSSKRPVMPLLSTHRIATRSPAFPSLSLNDK